MMEKIPILYCDDSLCIALKPPGLLSEHTPGGTGFPDLLAQQLGSRIFTVHRLDRDVGGIMLFSRNARVTGKLTAAMEAHKVRKTYLAVLLGIPESPAAELRDLLFRDSRKGKSFVVQRPRKGVREAVLRYQLLASQDQLSLVRIQLETGRTHQIRVQFSSRGLPLIGDGRYGGRDSRCNIALFSYALQFEHPVSGNSMTFSASPPASFPWSCFDASLWQTENPG